MTREGALLVMIGVTVVLLGLGVLAWRRRTRRDSGLLAPVGELPQGAIPTLTASGFYVATTRHGEALERLAITGLGFRSRVVVTVTDAGVALDLVGQPRMTLALDRIEAATLATVAIDRVVEPGGLVCVTWRARRSDGTDELVDSYLRPQDASARAVTDAIAATLPAAPTPDSATASTTGTDA